MGTLPAKATSRVLLATGVTLLLAFLGLAPVTVHAQDAAEASILSEAWREYAFMEFRKARRLFDRVIADPPNREDLCQALTGRAFCYQFGGRGNVTVGDFREALAAYGRCLQELGDGHRLAPFWLAMTAECHYRIHLLSRDAAALGEAEKLWQRLQRDHHDSIFNQDALLLRATAGLTDFKDARTTDRMAEIEAYLAEDAGKGRAGGPGLLAPVMANYLANAYFWRGDYARSVAWYREYCRLGPTSFRERNTVWFRVARIADEKLDDRDTAIEFYTKIWKEAPSDGKVYFCMERVRELMAGD